MTIKKFESHSTAEAIDVWCVLVNFEDWRGQDSVKVVGCYSTEMLAADKMIKYVNKYHKTNFEPFFENGVRLFTSVEENPDYEVCVEYCEENRIVVYISNSKLYTNALDN